MWLPSVFDARERWERGAQQVHAQGVEPGVSLVRLILPRSKTQGVCCVCGLICGMLAFLRPGCTAGSHAAPGEE